MDSKLKNILFNLKVDYAIFTKDLNLLDISPSLKLLLSKNKSTFYDLFPEFFGFEDQIKILIDEESDDIKLPNINKYDSNNNIVYLDYTLLLHENNLMVLVQDSTNFSLLKQKVQQQENEIKILNETIGHLRTSSIKNIWGESTVILEMRNFIKKVADLDSTTILLTGDSGTGKTLIARAIHSSSQNSETPFIEINCATIPETLIESEIFGHVRGAFTNAFENKKGLLAEADGGTLFLDEIGELPISVQSKFLSFLESQKYRPVGSTKENSVNVRIIAATNRDLKKAITNNDFREDLYYRINVVSLKIPSLVERGDDVIILARNFVKLLAIDLNREIIGLTKAAEEKIKNYNWPGNIRELKNVLERSVIFCENQLIDENDLLIEGADILNKRNNYMIPDSGISLEEVEKHYLITALKKASGNQTKASKLLNLSLDTFRYRLKKYNLS